LSNGSLTAATLVAANRGEGVFMESFELSRTAVAALVSHYPPSDDVVLVGPLGPWAGAIRGLVRLNPQPLPPKEPPTTPPTPRESWGPLPDPWTAALGIELMRARLEDIA
jgi:hypothetical protein